MPAGACLPTVHVLHDILAQAQVGSMLAGLNTGHGVLKVLLIPAQMWASSVAQPTDMPGSLLVQGCLAGSSFPHSHRSDPAPRAGGCCGNRCELVPS